MAWLRRNKIAELMLIFASLFAIAMIVVKLIQVYPDDLGIGVTTQWCQVRGVNTSWYECLSLFNSFVTRIEQALSLSLFLTVIALTVISTKLRYFAAIFSITFLVFMGVITPQELIEGVEWRLILFLIGSMALAYILRHLGVFRYLALNILRASGNSPTKLLIILSFISWFLAIAIDEATSIIYMVILILDIRKLVKTNVLPLIVTSVLATNTGSMAMPIGNPIGLYLAFSARLAVSDFIARALPASLISLGCIIVASRLLLGSYLRRLLASLDMEKVEILYTEFYTMLDKRGKTPLTYGIGLLFGFIISITFSELLAEYMTSVSGVYVDPHSLLAFFPYIFIFMSLGIYDPERMDRVLVHGVEWPSLFFFIALFMLGRSLLWTGVASRLAYAVGLVSLHLGERILKLALIGVTSATSAFLDNLSVIVAFTPVTQLLVRVGFSRGIYWPLLYGGVLGGNFTPIGSTANIVALGLCEKAKFKVTWRDWMRIALIPSLLAVILASAWTMVI